MVNVLGLFSQVLKLKDVWQFDKWASVATTVTKIIGFKKSNVAIYGIKLHCLSLWVYLKDTLICGIYICIHILSPDNAGTDNVWAEFSIYLNIEKTWNSIHWESCYRII